MKLLSCNIQNFGTISNKSYDFTNGINNIYENNGYGKTTIAAFIKAMLYGMETDNINAPDFRDRRHYAPFNGQKYGGTLIFEHQGKEYRIEKTFNTKSAAQDKVTLYIDKEEEPFIDELGEQILGLDKESFERLLFIDSNKIKMKSTGNIKNSLSKIVGEDIEGVDYDLVQKNLKEAKDQYYPLSRKADTKYIKAKKEKSALEQEIKTKEDIADSLQNMYPNRNSLSEELQELQKKKAYQSDMNTLLECWNTYEKMLEDIETKKGKIKNIEEFYPNGLPSDEEIDNIDKCREKILVAKTEQSHNTIGDEKMESLKGYEEMFKNGYPTSEEIDALDKGLLALENIKIDKAKKALSDEDTKRYNELDYKYRNNKPSKDDLVEMDKCFNEYQKEKNLSNNSKELSDEDKEIKRVCENKDIDADSTMVKTLLNEYQETDNKLKTTNKYDQTEGQSKAPKSKLNLILTIASIVIILGGVGLCFVKLVVGIILLSLGFIGLIVVGFLYLKTKIDNSGNMAISSQFMDASAILAKKEKELHTILTKYGIYSDNIYNDAFKFSSMIERYNQILKEENDAKSSKSGSATIIANCENALDAFLSKFGPYESYQDGLNLIKNEVIEYERLKDKYDKSIKDINDLNNQEQTKKKAIDDTLSKYSLVVEDRVALNKLIAEIDKYTTLKKEYEDVLGSSTENEKLIATLEKEIKDFDEKYSKNVFFEIDDINTIRTDRRELTTLSSQLCEKIAEADNYKKEKGLTTKPTEDDIDTNLDENIKNKTSEFARLEKDIEEFESKIEDLEDNKNRLKELNSLMAAYEKRFNLLCNLEESIKAAQKTLNDRYVEPIMNKFDYYSKLLGNVLNMKIEMGKDFEIRLDVNGEIKSSDHLSDGQKSICAICFRFALLSSIYNDDIPFVIMDDPFLTLDNSNMDSMKNMLKGLFSDKQVIYLTCHDSRNLV